MTSYDDFLRNIKPISNYELLTLGVGERHLSEFLEEFDPMFPVFPGRDDTDLI